MELFVCIGQCPALSFGGRSSPPAAAAGAGGGRWCDAVSCGLADPNVISCGAVLVWLLVLVCASSSIIFYLCYSQSVSVNT